MLHANQGAWLLLDSHSILHTLQSIDYIAPVNTHIVPRPMPVNPREEELTSSFLLLSLACLFHSASPFWLLLSTHLQPCPVSCTLFDASCHIKSNNFFPCSLVKNPNICQQMCLLSFLFPPRRPFPSSSSSSSYRVGRRTMRRKAKRKRKQNKTKEEFNIQGPNESPVWAWPCRIWRFSAPPKSMVFKKKMMKRPCARAQSSGKKASSHQALLKAQGCDEEKVVRQQGGKLMDSLASLAAFGFAKVVDSGVFSVK